MKTKREAILERLLRETWQCLPAILTEDCLLETDIERLAAMSDTVRAALGIEPVELEIFELKVPRRLS